MSEENFPRLDELFRASKGQPVDVDGQIARMTYEVPIEKGKASGVILVRGFKREPIQGICLEVEGGQLEINGVRHPGIVLWMDSAPREVEFRITGRSQASLRVWNCWRGQFGEREAWLGSAGVICKSYDRDYYRFLCSDGPGLVEFDAIEFDIEIQKYA